MLMCKDIALLASDYIDDEVKPLKRLSLRAHLMMCRRCRAFINHIRLTTEIIERHAIGQAHESYLERLEQAVTDAIDDRSR
ncbi:zf-HC2 domain-containing protein [Marinobacter fonticola]|uniref:zf-HC2 domain-containing protein n=1 Tax=Marinobacter fonticola TaxID=2603215 RepID=UPI0011E721DC|nr:zf-HC2 domain-containing protein [Marinobacter fonticola]